MVPLKEWLFSRRNAVTPAEQPRKATSTRSTERAEELIVQGNALEDNGEFASALERYREAAGIAPDFARAWVNVGNALQLMGNLDEAIVAQQKALQLEPENAPAHYNLGALLARMNDPPGAERELREALRLRPTMADAAIILADVLTRSGRAGEAEAHLRSALNLNPQSPMAANNLAGNLLAQDRVDDAEEVIGHGISLNPDVALLKAMLGAIYVKTGRAREAEPLFREAMASPDGLPGTENVLSPAAVFALNLRDDVDAESIFREHQRLGAAIDAVAGSPPTTFANTIDPDRPLKVGYVSGDFRQHPVALFIHPVLERHDRSRFEVHCYANHAVDDDFTRTLKRTVEHWHAVNGLNDTAVAEMIRRDGIDILVDLSGHTSDTRLSAFAHRAAPIQVTWLGYLNTTGLSSMDYRLSDRHADPAPEADALHTERVFRLPHSQWCYQPVYSIASSGIPHPESPDSLIFGSFNQFQKISDACLALWCSVLAKLPSAHLRVYAVPEGRTRSALLGRLARNGLDPARVSLYGRVDLLKYFGAIGDVDIALDTFPYNGATTTLDTLWMGVPIVALKGSRAISRGSFSINSSLGVPELIATTPAEYIEKNVRLAQDSALRLALRESLRQRLEASPLMDIAGFVKDLESGYREMWRDWCGQKTDRLDAR